MIPLTIPFYQTEWSGVDLLQVRQDVGQVSSQLPSAAFYQRYYEILEKKQIQFSDAWLANKQFQADFLRKKIDAHKGKNASILSIGAGTGIVEKPLIELGYTIDLQDFQESSFHTFGVTYLTNCYTCPINKIGKSYDVCFLNAVSYALTADDLETLLSDIYACLKPGGVLIWVDATFSWHEVYSFWRNKIRLKQECVLWGYKRNFACWQNFANDYTVLEKEYYGSTMQPENAITVMGLPLHRTPTWQCLILIKTG